MTAIRFVAAAALGAALMCAGTARAQDDWRTVEADRLLVIDTNKGRILVEMNPDLAPNHVQRIRELAGQGFYDNVKWHRVIDGFMAQTGDQTGTGEGSSPLPDLDAEFTIRRDPQSTFSAVARPTGAQVGFMDTVPVITQPDSYFARSYDGKVHAWATYCEGVAGMARDTAENSANAQFFLMRAAYPSLDKRYTVWGRVIDGQSVVNGLKDSPLPSGMVDEPDVMTRVRMGDQLPEAERPVVQVEDTRSTAFAARVESVRQARGADFSVCDVPINARVTAP